MRKPKPELTDEEINNAEATARILVAALPYEVLWAIAAEQGLRDSLGGMEYQHEVELLIKDAAVT